LKCRTAGGNYKATTVGEFHCDYGVTAFLRKRHLTLVVNYLNTDLKLKYKTCSVNLILIYFSKKNIKSQIKVEKILKIVEKKFNIPSFIVKTAQNNLCRVG